MRLFLFAPLCVCLFLSVSFHCRSFTFPPPVMSVSGRRSFIACISVLAEYLNRIVLFLMHKIEGFYFIFVLISLKNCIFVL